MSAGIDTQMVREYYQSLTDSDIIIALTRNATGLTREALEIVKEEVKRRGFDPEVLKKVAAQQEVEEEEGRAYDPDGCPVDEATRERLEEAFMFLLNLFGEENTLNRK